MEASHPYGCGSKLNHQAMNRSFLVLSIVQGNPFLRLPCCEWTKSISHHLRHPGNSLVVRPALQAGSARLPEETLDRLAKTAAEKAPESDPRIRSHTNSRSRDLTSVPGLQRKTFWAYSYLGLFFFSPALRTRDRESPKTGTLVILFPHVRIH